MSFSAQVKDELCQLPLAFAPAATATPGGLPDASLTPMPDPIPGPMPDTLSDAPPASMPDTPDPIPEGSSDAAPPILPDCCARSELYGALLHTSLFSHREIRVSTSSAAIANRLQQLFQRVAGFTPVRLYTDRKTQLLVTHPAELKRVFELFGYTYQSHVTYHLNRNILENDCCIPAFLRGMFLLTGTVAGPDKKSHLEMKSAHPSLCGEVISLLLDLHFCPKLVQRQGVSLLYFKDSASVQRFLSLIGAPQAANVLKQARKVRHLRNHINRQANCDTANLVKATDASIRQVTAIRRALQENGKEVFPAHLHETIRLRLEYPMDSLSELAARFNPPISKPGLSHRLNRITALAQQTKKED